MRKFDDYIFYGEPGQKEKADTGRTAIGVQVVENIKVSPYQLDTAQQ